MCAPIYAKGTYSEYEGAVEGSYRLSTLLTLLTEESRSITKGHRVFCPCVSVNSESEHLDPNNQNF